MIGETGLASVLPGILELGDLDRDTEAGEDRRIKTEYDIKTELPDSCSGIFLLVHPRVNVKNIESRTVYISFVCYSLFYQNSKLN